MIKSHLEDIDTWGACSARTVKPHSAGEMRLEVWRGKAWRASTRSPDYTKFIVLPSAKSTELEPAGLPSSSPT